MKKDKLMEMSLGDRMKYYESQDEKSISPDSHIICRIDGHKFSKFTKSVFKKPFDGIFSEAMSMVASDLLDEFNAVVSYTQSDEITLVIPSLKDRTIDNRELKSHKIDKKIRKDWMHFHSGRVQKMSSLIAGFCTMKFNLHLKSLAEKAKEYTNDEKHQEYCQNIIDEKAGKAYFDCRVYGVPSNEEAFNSILWRVRDCTKNSKSMFSQQYCSHKSLQGLTGNEQIQYCLYNTGKNWNSVQDRYKYGTIFKKQKYIKKVQNDYIDDNVIRTKTTQFSIPLDFSKENVKMIMEKTIELKGQL